MSERYQILEPLGEGGMGKVFRARDAASGEEVALKQIEVAGARAERELGALARLDHPAIVRVRDHFTSRQGQPTLVLDLLPGSLERRLRRQGPLGEREALEQAIVLAEGLEHAHGQGVLHRDLKPANVLLRADGRPVLTDFGLAHLADERERLTRTGEILGTPGYLAPEQANAESAAIGPATDVYGLGATLFAMLTGRPPFQGTSVMNTLKSVILDPPPRPSAERPGLSSALDAVVGRCLAKDPAERYPTAGALLGALRGVQDAVATTPAPPRGVALGLSAALVVLGAASGWAIYRSRRSPDRVAVAPPSGPPASSQPPSSPAAAPSSPAAAPSSPAAALTAQEVQEVWGQLRREPQQARQRLEAHLRAAPDDAQAWVLLARAHRRLADLEGALQALAQALTHEPRQLEALALRAELHLEAGHAEQALADTRAALEIDPGDLGVLRMNLQSQTGRLAPQEFVQRFDALVQRARAAQPQTARGCYEQGRVLAAGHLEGPDGLQRLLDASRAFEEAAILDPRDGFTPAELANARWRAVGIDQELEQRGLPAPGGDWCRQQLRQALADARRAVALDPYHASAQFNLATVLDAFDMHAEAADAMTRRAELVPWLADGWPRAALSDQRAERWAEAERAWSRVLERDPGSFQAWYGRGFARLQLGRADASGDLRRARELAAPDSDARREIQTMLDQLDQALGR